MDTRLRVILLFSILLLQFTFATTISDGVVNLSNHEFKGKSIPIRGETSLYWGRFLTTQELDTATPSAVMNVPGVWNSCSVDGKKLDPNGYVTVMLRLTADSLARQKLAILLAPIFSSYRLYVDTALIVECGDPQKRPETTINNYQPRLAEFSFKSDTVKLIFHISNFFISELL